MGIWATKRTKGIFNRSGKRYRDGIQHVSIRHCKRLYLKWEISNIKGGHGMCFFLQWV